MVGSKPCLQISSWVEVTDLSNTLTYFITSAIVSIKKFYNTGPKMSGTNSVKLLTIVIHKVLDKLENLSLADLSSLGRSLPYWSTYQVLRSKVGSWPYYTRLETPTRYKHFSMLRTFVITSVKSFTMLDPGWRTVLLPVSFVKKLSSPIWR